MEFLILIFIYLYFTLSMISYDYIKLFRSDINLDSGLGKYTVILFWPIYMIYIMLNRLLTFIYSIFR